MKTLVAVLVMAAGVWLSQPVVVAGAAHGPHGYATHYGELFYPAADLDTTRFTWPGTVECGAC